MINIQKQIIDLISEEISEALNSCESSRHESGGDPDKIDSYISSYATRVKILRAIRIQLEDEFSVMHYDPR